MFKLQPKTTFWAKCPISIAGEKKPVEIEIEFKYMSRDALKLFFENLDGKTDLEAISEIAMDWRGLDGEFSEENLNELLNNYPTAGTSLFEAFRSEMLEAKTKN